MKRIFALGASALLFAAAYAAAPVLSVNGEPVQKTLTRITFDGDNVVAVFGDETQSYDMETVVVSFPTTGIGDVEFFTTARIVGDEMMVEGLRSGAAVEIYNVSGSCVVSAIAADSRASIDLSSLPAGVYLLRSGKSVVKFVKR